MYNFNCPKCDTRNKSENITDGAVATCAKCQQRMRVSLADDSEVRQPAGMGYGPVLLGGGAMGGLMIGGLILLLGPMLVGKAPENNRVQNSELQKTTEVAAKPEPADKKKSAPKEEYGLKADVGPLSSDELYQQMLKSSVWILATDGKDVWSGSGSLVDRDERLVLTNEHVANSRCKSITVLFPIYRDGKLVTERAAYEADIKNKGITATLVDERPSCDLALIRLAKLPEGVKAHRLSRRKLWPGQTLHTVGGSPRGNDGMWIYSSGTIRQILTREWDFGDKVKHKAEVIASSVATNSGDSGGAVVDSRGTMVGVHSMSSAGVLNVGHIHVNEVRKFLIGAYQGMGKQFTEAPDEELAATPNAVVKLMKGLAAPESEGRIQAAAALGRIGPEAQKAAVDLLRIVRNPNEVAAVRRAAVRALDEIGQPSVDQLKLLLSALTDKKCLDARRYAAKSLVNFPEDMRPEAIKALAKALKDDDATVRQNAVRSLSSYGKVAQDEAYQDMVDLLRDPEEKVRWEAYNGLEGTGVPEQADLAVAKDLLEGEKEGKKPTLQARYWGVYVIVQKLKEKGLPLLQEALDKEENFKDPIFVKYVIRQLRSFKLNSLEVGSILSKTLDHRNEFVQIETMRALADLDFGENTVEAYLKVFAKRKSNLAGEKLRPALTTFNKNRSPGYKNSPKLVAVLLKGLDETEDLARFVAVCCLGAIGKDAAEVTPALGAALVKEKSAALRIEILAALAAMGEAGGRLIEDNKEVQDELAKWVNAARADDRVSQVMAALTVASLYPGKPSSSKAYRVLAGALLLTNAPITLDLVQRTAFGLRTTAINRGSPDKIHEELHERAKDALSLGGVVAGEAICEVFESSFWSTPIEKVDIICDKLHARITAFKVLAKIGPCLKDVKRGTSGLMYNPVKRLLDKLRDRVKKGREDPRVVDAAREANVEIFRK